MTVRLSRFRAFLLVSGLLILGTVLAAGTLVGAFFERHILDREERQTTAIVQLQARQHLTPEDFHGDVPAARAREFESFLEGLPGIFRIKVFAPSGQIVWSNEPRLIGLSFPDNDSLQAALRGQVTTVLGRPTRWEHIFERSRQHIAEVYVPITFPGRPAPVGVIETYRDTTSVIQDLRRLQRTIWGITGGIGLLLHVSLAAVVWKASVNERRAIRELETQNRHLTTVHRVSHLVMHATDPTGVLEAVVTGLGPDLRLSTASVYRTGEGRAPTLLASWPVGSPPAEMSRADISDEPAIREGRLRVSLAAADDGRYVLVGSLGAPAEAVPTGALRTLEIVLGETAIALANTELFAQIRQANERLGAILAAAADRMAILDRDMRVVWMNAAASASAGADAVGRACFEVMGVSGDGCNTCPALWTFRSGQVERGIRAQETPDGGTRYLDLITAPLHDQAGHVHQVLEVARDITALVEMEERLKAANRALVDTQAKLLQQERMAAVGEVVVGLHHAILNPLTGALGALAVLQSTGDDAAQRSEVIAAATAEIRKIEKLVKRLPTMRRAPGTPYVGDLTMVDLEEEPSAEPDPRPAPVDEPPRG